MGDLLAARPLSGALGAEITGVDLSRPLGTAAAAEIRQALLDHLVIFFAAQELTPKSLLAFARCLGEPLAYPQLQGLPEEPLVTAVTKLEHERVAFGGVWHTDTSYLERPPMGSLLYAVELPPWGGDTLFANQYLAYERLSGGLQRTLAGLTAICTSAKPAVAATREERLREQGAQALVLASEHPVVRTHPETGRKALYVNRGHTSHFKGWSETESRPLLEYLFQRQVQPELTCRYRWRPGSLAVWDNRCTQHLPINDYHGFRRVMHRVTLSGDRPS